VSRRERIATLPESARLIIVERPPSIGNLLYAKYNHLRVCQRFQSE
jgi:hypothetical protein